MINEEKICTGFQSEYLDYGFRQPLVDVDVMKHCQYNRQRNAEDFIWENAGYLYILVMDDYIEYSKLEDLKIKELYNEVEEFYLKLEELREIRYAGIDVDTEIANLVEQCEPLVDKLYHVLEKHNVI
jgi:hypothetical protein